MFLFFEFIIIVCFDCLTIGLLRCLIPYFIMIEPLDCPITLKLRFHVVKIPNALLLIIPSKRLRVSSGIAPTLRGGEIAVVDTIGISCNHRFLRLEPLKNLHRTLVSEKFKMSKSSRVMRYFEIAAMLSLLK